MLLVNVLALGTLIMYLLIVFSIGLKNRWDIVASLGAGDDLA